MSDEYMTPEARDKVERIEAMHDEAPGGTFTTDKIRARIDHLVDEMSEVPVSSVSVYYAEELDHLASALKNLQTTPTTVVQNIGAAPPRVTAAQSGAIVAKMWEELGLDGWTTSEADRVAKILRKILGEVLPR